MTKYVNKSIQTDDGAVALAGCLFILLLIPLIWLLSTVLVLVAWNLGVTNIVDASGGHVDNINFWTAFGVSFLIGIVSRIFKRGNA